MMRGSEVIGVGPWLKLKFVVLRFVRMHRDRSILTCLFVQERSHENNHYSEIEKKPG